MSGLALHGYWRSSAAYRVRLALAWKRLPFTHVAVNLAAGAQAEPEYRALALGGLVPVLVADGVALRQSLAIIEWLDETYPEPALLPREPLVRARVRAAAMDIACDVHPLGNLRVLKRLKAMDHTQDVIDAWMRHWIALGFDMLEPIAAAAGGPHLMGAEVTLADLCLTPQLYNARRFGLDLTPYPALVAADAALLALPGMDAARPERQPDAPAA